MDTGARAAPQTVPLVDTQPVEPRRVRLRRHVRHVRLYASAFALVGLLVIVVALAAANTRHVKVDWLLGSGGVSLVGIVVVAAVLGWLLGIVTSVTFSLRTRRRRPQAPQ